MGALISMPPRRNHDHFSPPAYRRFVVYQKTFGPFEYRFIHRVRLLGNKRFVQKVSDAIRLLQESPKFMNAVSTNIRWIVQSRCCNMAMRTSRTIGFGRTIHLDIGSTRVSRLGLASFLVNEAKWIEIKHNWSLASRLSFRWFRATSVELREELACLHQQIQYLKEVAPESSLTHQLQFTFSLLEDSKFFDSISSWLESNC